MENAAMFTVFGATFWLAAATADFGDSISRGVLLSCTITFALSPRLSFQP